MSKLLVSSVLIMFPVFAQQMVIHLSDGNQQTVPVEDIEKITFDDISPVYPAGEKPEPEARALLLSKSPVVEFPYYCPVSGPVELKLRTLAGQIIFHHRMRVDSPGARTFTWHPKSESGGTVQPGFHSLEITFSDKSTFTRNILLF